MVVVGACRETDFPNLLLGRSELLLEVMLSQLIFGLRVKGGRRWASAKEPNGAIIGAQDSITGRLERVVRSRCPSGGGLAEAERLWYDSSDR